MVKFMRVQLKLWERGFKRIQYLKKLSQLEKLHKDTHESSTTSLSLQKLVNLDIYDILGDNLSDSNVGARKKRNIRNHSLIVNSSIHEANKNKKSKGLEILIANYRQCFDGMSLPITLNAFTTLESPTEI